MQPSDADRPTFIDLAVKAGLVPADTPARDATTIIQAGLATEEALLALARDHAEAGAGCPVCRGPLVTLRRTPALQLACDRCGLDVALDVTLSSGRALPADAPAEVRDAAADPRHHFGTYVLVREIGRGGFGSVYRAWHRPLNRFVAVKFMTSDDPKDAARFQREAQTSARLSHPHIVPIYEVGQLQGRHYIAMEFVDGRNLTHHRLAPRRAVEVIRDAADAVHYAHTLGVIHRDIKPHNLMLDARHHVWIMDFGIARPVGTGATLTVTGTVVGTPAYMAPERAEGKPGDARSDVYALGATLYEVLTGRAPFDAATPFDTLQQVLTRDPAPPRRFNSAIPHEVETIVLKAMDKDPARRYATARDLADDLRRWLDGEPIGATRASIPYRLRKSIARQPVIWSLGALLALAVVLGGRGLIVSRGNLQRALDAERERLAAERTLTDRLRTQELVERTARRLRDIEAALSRRLSDERLAELHAEIDGIVAQLTADEPGLWHLRGEAHRLRHRGAEAIADYTRAVDAPSSPVRAAAALGRARLRLEELVTLRIVTPVDTLLKRAAREERVTRLLQEDLKIASGGRIPEESRALPAIWSALATRNYEFAHRHATLEIAAGGAAADFFLARAFTQGGSVSLDDLNMSLERHRAQPMAWTCRGVMRAQTGDPLGAIADCTEALRYDDRCAPALFTRGSWYHKLREPDRARADLERAASIDPTHAPGWAVLGQVHAVLGDMAAAEASLARAIALEPQFALAYLSRAQIREAAGRLDESLADFGTGIRLDPANGLAYAGRAQLRFTRQEYAEAVDDLTRAIERLGDQPPLYTRRGYARALGGDTQAGLADINRAISLDPSRPAPYFTRARVRRMAGNRSGAAMDLRRYLELAPDGEDAAAARAMLEELKRE